ncbi:hypothetical protein HPP92_000244 [Vanilla planifolia]|uniref:Uncharacterized protein n=1 Tax=Vanilla planifolia TaxID=51239 RepID=A0A835S9T0_VANPL|nr:hypothetical protein HPP92_000244 [Vanilla planifolia]
MEEISDLPGPSQAAPRFEEEDDEGDVCRICRNPGDADNPLRYPLRLQRKHQTPPRTWGHDADDDGQERQGARAARRAVPANRPQAIDGNAKM